MAYALPTPMTAPPVRATTPSPSDAAVGGAGPGAVAPEPAAPGLYHDEVLVVYLPQSLHSGGRLLPHTVTSVIPPVPSVLSMSVQLAAWKPVGSTKLRGLLKT